MKPVDLRNEAFEAIRKRLADDRLAVYLALQQHGGCTTRTLARLMERDILSVRPRVSELVDLGAVELYDRHGHEGVYCARTEPEWALWVEARRTEHAEQMLLKV